MYFLQAFFNNFIPDHDSDVFRPPSLERLTPFDQAASIAFEGYKRWDGVYLLHIAEHGYTYENCLAFFPLFPLIVQLTADSILFPLQYVMSISSVLLVSASILNFWFFIQAAKVFYRLSVCVLKDETLAFKAAQLFCINPASIFFSACYTESLYCVLTLNGMLQFERRNFMISAFFFALSGATRSNGLVNLGFLLYAMGIQFLKQIKTGFEDSKTKRIGLTSIFMSTVAPSIFYTVLCSLPYLIFQFYAYSVFCNPDASETDLKAHILTYGNEKGYKMAHTGLSPYCYSLLPFSYSYVQKNHWGVGFLMYYEYKQIPNFMLAGPMIALCTGAIVYYTTNVMPLLLTDATAKIKKDDDIKQQDVKDTQDKVKDPDIPKIPGVVNDQGDGTDLKERKKSSPNGGKSDAKGAETVAQDNQSNEDANVEKQEDKGDQDCIGLAYFCQEKLLVYVVHLFFLTFVGVFIMHVQV